MPNLAGRPKCVIQSGNKAPSALPSRQPINPGFHWDPRADLPTDRAPRSSHLLGAPRGRQPSFNLPRLPRAERGAPVTTSRRSAKIEAASAMQPRGGR
ncbi:hypothetical protein NDU88_003098 [Pleurodeles waltl]|uniref:Uncharacterized protein n=1 Tax=Pleurodeles waltl TaxID=8319 RepID=A0AAV7W159_PLEWA|nr:hypothetical protein NDU88_003098 [Pleurodeles waltl]